MVSNLEKNNILLPLERLDENKDILLIDDKPYLSVKISTLSTISKDDTIVNEGLFSNGNRDLIKPIDTIANMVDTSITNTTTTTTTMVNVPNNFELNEIVVNKDGVIRAYSKLTDENEIGLFVVENDMTEDLRIFYPQRLTLNDENLQNIIISSSVKDIVIGPYSNLNTIKMSNSCDDKNVTILLNDFTVYNLQKRLPILKFDKINLNFVINYFEKPNIEDGDFIHLNLLDMQHHHVNKINIIFEKINTNLLTLVIHVVDENFLDKFNFYQSSNNNINQTSAMFTILVKSGGTTVDDQNNICNLNEKYIINDLPVLYNGNKLYVQSRF